MFSSNFGRSSIGPNLRMWRASGSRRPGSATLVSAEVKSCSESVCQATVSAGTTISLEAGAASFVAPGSAGGAGVRRKAAPESARRATRRTLAIGTRIEGILQVLDDVEEALGRRHRERVVAPLDARLADAEQRDDRARRRAREQSLAADRQDPGVGLRLLREREDRLALLVELDRDVLRNLDRHRSDQERRVAQRAHARRRRDAVAAKQQEPAVDAAEHVRVRRDLRIADRSGQLAPRLRAPEEAERRRDDEGEPERRGTDHGETSETTTRRLSPDGTEAADQGGLRWPGRAVFRRCGKASGTPNSRERRVTQGRGD